MHRLNNDPVQSLDEARELLVRAGKQLYWMTISGECTMVREDIDAFLVKAWPIKSQGSA